MDRRSFLTAVGALAVCPGRAFAAPEASVSAAAARDDVALLVDAYSQLHPGLHRYLRPGEFAARAARLTARIGGDVPLRRLYVELAALAATVRCGHSYPNPLNQSPAARSALFAGLRGVPFSFRWLDGKMIVSGGRGGDAPFPPGTEILAIDGIGVGDLLGAMLPLARADGGNDAKRVAQLEVDGRSRYPSFDVYRHLLHPPVGGPMRIDARRPGAGMDRMELAGADATVAAKTAGASWSFDVQDGIGTLGMATWALYDSKWDWAAFIDAAMDRLIDEGARGLVVDLRGNEGGLDCGNRLIARLTDRPLPLPRHERRVRYRRVPERLAPHLDTWDPGFKDWGSAASGPGQDGFYRLSRGEEGAGHILPSGRRFAGKVAVLVDASCSSATFHFAQAVREARLATLIGEPTGGNRRGINGGAFFFLRLPRTGLEVDLPLIGYFPASAQPDAGLKPDRLVRTSRADLVAGRDRQREAALRHLG